MSLSNTQKLIISIVATVGIGSLGGIFTIAEIPNWYAGLNKPSFNPPNWLFGPVWTSLYTDGNCFLFNLETTGNGYKKKSHSDFYYSVCAEFFLVCYFLFPARYWCRNNRNNCHVDFYPVNHYSIQ